MDRKCLRRSVVFGQASLHRSSSTGVHARGCCRSKAVPALARSDAWGSSPSSNAYEAAGSSSHWPATNPEQVTLKTPVYTRDLYRPLHINKLSFYFLLISQAKWRLEIWIRKQGLLLAVKERLYCPIVFRSIGSDLPRGNIWFPNMAAHLVVHAPNVSRWHCTRWKRAFLKLIERSIPRSLSPHLSLIHTTTESSQNLSFNG
jgi:hypothetical protein